MSTCKSSYPIKKRAAIMAQDPTSDSQDQANKAAAALASLSDSSAYENSCENPEPGKLSGLPNDDDSFLQSDSEESYSSQNDVSPKPVHAPSLNKMMVDHTYIDYGVIKEGYLSFLEDGEEEVKSNLTEEEKDQTKKRSLKIRKLFGDVGPSRKNSGGVVKPFPEKLMEVLERDDMESIITWMPHGRAFIVLQPQQLRDIVLPRFFKQTKFMSFTRQLNLWGFKRITKGVDSGAYYHALFLRGRRCLAMLMRRQKIKGTGIKLSPSPETEPNFYEISEKSPVPAIDPSMKETKPLPPLRQHIQSRATLDPALATHEYDRMKHTYPFNSSTQNISSDPLGLLGMRDNFAMPLLQQQHQQLNEANEYMSFLQQKAYLEQQQQQQQRQHFGQSIASTEQLLNRFNGCTPHMDESLQLQELKQRLFNAVHSLDHHQPQPQHMLMHHQQHNPMPYVPLFPSDLSMVQVQQQQQPPNNSNNIAALMNTLQNTRNVAIATQARLSEVTRGLQNVPNMQSL